MFSPLETVCSLLAPYECAICKTEGFMLCPACCEAELEQPISRCYLCNKLTSQNTVCISCRSRSSVRRVWWLGHYESPLKELIHALKYQRRRAYGTSFGVLLSERLPYVPESTLIVPAPTASIRVRERGFDQAKQIALGFAKARHLQLAPLLYRSGQADQIGKNRRQRKQQITNALKFRSKTALRGKSILLIDDVLTTGATLEAAARLLRDHGAAHVDAAVVARHLLS